MFYSASKNANEPHHKNFEYSGKTYMYFITLWLTVDNI